MARSTSANLITALLVALAGGCEAVGATQEVGPKTALEPADPVNLWTAPIDREEWWDKQKSPVEAPPLLTCEQLGGTRSEPEAVRILAPYLRQTNDATWSCGGFRIHTRGIAFHKLVQRTLVAQRGCERCDVLAVYDAAVQDTVVGLVLPATTPGRPRGGTVEINLRDAPGRAGPAHLMYARFRYRNGGAERTGVLESRCVGTDRFEDACMRFIADHDGAWPPHIPERLMPWGRPGCDIRRPCPPEPEEPTVIERDGEEYEVRVVEIGDPESQEPD